MNIEHRNSESSSQPGDMSELRDQLQLAKVEKISLVEEVERWKEEAARARQAYRELTQQTASQSGERIKRLQRFIRENIQHNAPRSENSQHVIASPIDDEIVTSFNRLNQDITRCVKKHFTRPLRMGIAELEQSVWSEIKSLSGEIRELWVRASIADDLYEEFFAQERKVFGFDNEERERAMREFESALAESGKGSFGPLPFFLFFLPLPQSHCIYIYLKRFSYYIQ